MLVQLNKLSTILIFLIFISACAAKPVAEDFGFTTKVVTLASEKGGVFYLLQLELLDTVPDNSNLFLSYEVLAEPGRYKTLALGGMGEARMLNFRSVTSPAVDANHIYTLQLYLQDPDTGQTVAAYNALLKSEISAKVSQLLGIQLL